jgi:hypothetical protein
MRTSLIALTLAVAASFWTASAQQEVRPTPGPGSGTMTVRGTVDVANVVDVTAAQRGEWRVAVSSVPPVVLAGPPFIANGGRYAVSWSHGATPENITIVGPGRGGWVQVESSGGQGRRRWVNLDVAVSVEDAR